MRALVTGGTGFIGSHLVEALLAGGVEVCVLVRDPSQMGWIAGKDVKTFTGDCTDPESLVGITRGMDYVFHNAGVTKAASPDEYYRVNSEGTRNMLKAAAEDAPGLRKFVFISSQAAAGPSTKATPRREEDPASPVTDYGRSKLAGESHAQEFKDALPVVILRPTAVYGPRDRDVYTFFKMVSRGIRTTFAEERLVSLCYVKDLVEGMILAAEADTASGDAFFIGYPEPYDWDYIGKTIAGAMGVKPVRLVVPVGVLSVVAVVSEAIGALTGRPALLNRQKMAEIRQRYWVADTCKAAAGLGFTARHDFSSGAELTVRWYRENGWI